MCVFVCLNSESIYPELRPMKTGQKDHQDLPVEGIFGMITNGVELGAAGTEQPEFCHGDRGGSRKAW